VLLSRTEVRPTGDVGDRHTDVVEVDWASAADRIKDSDSHLEQYLLTYWQPVEHVVDLHQAYFSTQTLLQIMCDNTSIGAKRLN